MTIGIYLQTEHLGEWNWEDVLGGRIAVSGTDYRNIDLAYQLSRRGLRVVLFATQDPLPSPPGDIKVISVTSLSEAATEANAEVDLLWFSNREEEDTWAGIRTCGELEVPCIISSGIDLSPETADLVHRTRSIRRLVTVSAAQADLLRDHPVFSKTEAIYVHGLKPAFLEERCETRDRNPRSVGFLGSLTLSKGFQHVARAWPAVKEAVPKATLEVIGSARLYDRDQSLGPLGVASEGFERERIIPHLGERPERLDELGVTFHGLLPPVEIRNLLETVAIGVVNPICSGSIETFCVSAVEVQACGAAVVSANRVGLKETARHGETGVLIQSEEELASVLIDLLENPSRTREMGKKGREWTRSTFTQEQIVKEWIDLLKSVHAGDPPSPPSFSWRRATPRTTLRECIRKARSVPGIGRAIPTLRSLREKIDRTWK